ncbi:MAG: winged helix-turn-helix domain-containing protein [Bacteroidota bacterium]
MLLPVAPARPPRSRRTEDAPTAPPEAAILLDPARPGEAARALCRLLGLAAGDEAVVLAVAGRRLEPLAPDTLLEFGALQVSLAARRVSVNGRPVDLTPVEFDLLAYLARHPGRTFSRTELLDAVWGYDYDGYCHTVNSHVHRLRAKIEPVPEQPVYVQTVIGTGYRFGPFALC